MIYFARLPTGSIKTPHGAKGGVPMLPDVGPSFHGGGGRGNLRGILVHA